MLIKFKTENLIAKLQNLNRNFTFSWVSLIGFSTTWPEGATLLGWPKSIYYSILLYVTEITGNALVNKIMCNVLYLHLQTATVQSEQRKTEMVTLKPSSPISLLLFYFYYLKAAWQPSIFVSNFLFVCFRFKQHINSNPIAAVLCTEELLKLRAEVAAAPPGLTSAEAEPLITVASPSSKPPGKCIKM